MRQRVGKLAVFAFAVVGKHGGGYHGEREHRFVALLVEPSEEKFLQARHARPHGFSEIGEHKIAKHRVKIIAVIQRNIPKHALIAARGGGLIDAVHHLLQGVFNLAAVGVEVIVAKILAGKVVKISNKFNRCHRARKLRAYRKHKIDKRAAKRGQMLRRARFAAQFG